ncbi:MAG: glycosyltransferase [Candidatus Adiutrix sp.]|nr:glycosyltransferase [Candidatus Adiutrix sp.]
MHILCLGSEYFHEAFIRLGHKVLTPPHEDGYPLSEMYHRLTDRPDLLVYTDHLGRHAWPQGLEDLEIPKVYYAVDTPINFWWQKHFAGLFDLVLADQKPYAEKFAARGLAADWLPVAVDTRAYRGRPGAGTEKIYDFGFVGVLDEKVRAKRSRLVKQLSGRYRLKSMGDRQEGWLGPEDSAAVYGQSRLVLNENLFPGVTTRMFEALASGTVLFTEKAGGDLAELFLPGEDFAWFEPQELFEAAEYWLADEARLKKTAARALDKVMAGHDILHRAETLLKAAAPLNLSRAPQGAGAWDLSGRTLFLTALRWPAEGGKERLARAESLLLRAAEEGGLSPEGKFMLGHIARMKGDADRAVLWLTRAWDEGCQRAALGLGVLAMSTRRTEEAARWLGAFTGLGPDFPVLTAGQLHFEAVLPIAARLMEMGEGIYPGFNLLPHDPALWTAFEFYLSAHQAKPAALEVGRALSGLLLNCHAPAEAMDVARATLEHHPQDEVLSQLYCRAAQASYLSLN